MNKNLISARRSQSGSALLAVLCLIFTGSLIAAVVMMIAQSSAFTIQPYAELQRSFYINEGAANRIQYLISADRALYGSNPGMDSFDYGQYTAERFIADGSEHTLDYYGCPIRFQIQDAMATGIDLSTSTYENSLRNLGSGQATDTELAEKIEAARQQIADYSDQDSTSSGDYGMEADDFEVLGQSPLPADSAPLMREELCYLPKVMDLFPPDADGRLSGIRLISNMLNSSGGGGGGGGGRRSPRMSQNSYPTIFTASDDYLRNACGLDDAQIAEVREALRLYYAEKTPLSQSMEGTLLSTLRSKRNLNWYYSDFQTIIIRPAPGENGRVRPSKRLVFTFQPSGPTGPSDGFVRYFEWMFF